MNVVFSAKCLEYWERGHPESPDRVYRVHKLLKENGYEFTEPDSCSEEDLLVVHSKGFIENVRRGDLFDLDTPNLPGIYDYARLSAGAAIKAMETALSGGKAFSLMRPPGHHAGVNGRALGAASLGFCYFNNIAVACEKALNRVDKIAIVDIDCHHGNGTQEIFLGSSDVLFVSLHRYALVYPGTGAASEKNCLNYPFTSPPGDAEYLATLRSALEEVERFDPDLVAVSAGFDGHKHDPVCGLGLSEEAYVVMGRMIAELGRRAFAVLEGGYGQEFPMCVYGFLVGLEQS